MKKNVKSLKASRKKSEHPIKKKKIHNMFLNPKKYNNKKKWQKNDVRVILDCAHLTTDLKSTINNELGSSSMSNSSIKL